MRLNRSPARLQLRTLGDRLIDLTRPPPYRLRTSHPFFRSLLSFSPHSARAPSNFDANRENVLRYDHHRARAAITTHVKPKRKSPAGVASNKLIFTAHHGTNADVFPYVLSLYVPKGSKVADVTYGNGVFWKRVPEGTFELLPTDLVDGVDARTLPYPDQSLDCVVFDPPYMHTPGGTAYVNHQSYERYYRNNSATSDKKYHEAVLDLYFSAAKESHRVLRPDGIYIVKCADEVCASQQRLTHVELINEFQTYGFVIEDLFILTRLTRPGVSRLLRQAHARKTHSYFLVFRKPVGKSRWRGLVDDQRFMPAETTTLPLFK